MTKERSRSLLALAGFGLDTAGAAWCGARYCRKGSRDSWYRDLGKPSFTPPDAVFPVVRTSLYALIAWSECRIWSAAPSREFNTPSGSGFHNSRPTLSGRRSSSVSDAQRSPWQMCWRWKR